MPTITSDLVVRLRDMVSKPARAAATGLKQIRTAFKGLSSLEGMDSLNASIARNNSKLRAARGQMLEAAGGFYALKAAISAPTRAAMELESAMADVRKVVDFPTPEGFKQFQQQILALSTSVPIAADGLAAIAASAGQAGIPLEDLAKWTEMAAKVGVAFDMGAGAVGEDLAKIRTALGLSTDETALLADAFNHLSNNMASTAPDLMDVMKRVGGQAVNQFGLATHEVAALASAMLAAGFEANVVATSLRNMGTALTAGEAATKAQRKGLAALGLEAKQVASDMQKDAVGALQEVLTKINSLPVERQAAVMTQIFGKEARALSALVTNADLLAGALETVAEQSKYAGSASAEYAVRADTFANKMQLFQNQIRKFSASLGNALIPVLSSLMDALQPVIDGITWVVTNFPNASAAVFGLAAGFVALKVAVAGLSFAGLMGKGGALQAIKGLRIAMMGLVSIGAAPLVAISAAFAGIGAALLFIKNNWEGVKAFFSGFADGFSEAFKPVAPVIEPVIGYFKDLFSWINDLLGPIDATKAEWTSWGQAAGEAVGGVVSAVVGLPGKIGEAISSGVSILGEYTQQFFQGGYDLIMALWNGMKQVFNDLVAWVDTKVGQLLGPIQKAASAVSGMFNGSNNPALPAGHPAAQLSGRRKNDGPVSRGNSYWAGEAGPELITPTRSGFVHSNKDSIGGGGTVNFNPSIIIQGAGNTDTGALVAQVRDVMRDEVRELFRGVYSDTGVRFS